MKKELINLARQSIKAYLEGKHFEPEEKIKKEFSDKKACFVTLTLKGELRGCIGSLEARQELWKDVVNNSINAGFNDFRFNPLKKDEFEKIKIEISILTTPREIKYNNLDELKNKIYKKGVIIKKGFNSATYLPQVWDNFIKTDDFLSSLCLKAGLSKDSWKRDNLSFFIYEVEKVK